MSSCASVIKPPESSGVESETERDRLVALVYDELRRLAVGFLRLERPDHTLQPTALVHEAYLRLVGQGEIRWQNREHFVGVAAMMMRRILVNYAVSRGREKRGGGEIKLSFAEAERLARVENLDMVALDEALSRLALQYPQEAQVIELRFFGGLSILETAGVLGVSESTVERDWRFARAWLHAALRGR